MAKGLNRIQLSTVIGFAGIGGILTGGMGLMLHRKQQSRLQNQPYFITALNILNKNTRAVEMIGKPIKIGLVDFNREGTIFEADQIDMEIPLTGKSNSGHLRVKAYRHDPREAKWIVDRVEFRSDPRKDTPMKGKTFIIFRHEQKDSSSSSSS